MRGHICMQIFDPNNEEFLSIVNTFLRMNSKHTGILYKDIFFKGI